MTVLASGTGQALVTPAIAQRLAQVEAHQPPGTRFQLQGQWTVVTLPAVGPIHTGAIAAAAVNSAWQAGRLASGGHLMPLWPGARAPATYHPPTRTLTVRWVGASAYIDGIVAALAGTTAGFIAETLGLPVTTAVEIGIGVALAVGAAFVASYLVSWLWLGEAPSHAAQTSSLVGTVVAVAALGTPLVLLHARQRREKG
jgi:hypothetical protein